MRVELKEHGGSRHFIQVHMSYHAGLKELFKSWPGSYWFPPAQAWVVPSEYAGWVIAACKQVGFHVVLPDFPKEDVQLAAVPQPLHPFQAAAVQRCLANEGRWLFCDEMGLGKTPQAIVAAHTAGCQKILVVCPAIVRQAWLRELDKWWPGHPTAGAILYGASRKSLTIKQKQQQKAAYAADIQVVSYNLLGEIKTVGWDCIIFDECHRIKSQAAKQSQLAKNIADENPSAHIYGLTATILPNSPADAWNIVHTIWHARFGRTAWKYLNRYTNAYHNGYGWTFSGINEVHAKELRMRLAAMLSRTTKQEVAHLLPAFDVQDLRISMGKRVEAPKNKDEYDEVVGKVSGDKMPYILEWVGDSLESTSHVAVLTHLRSTASACAREIKSKCKVPVYHIDGSIPPDKRHEILDRAARDRRGVLCATMHSVGIGIDMTFCRATLFAELYWRPETMVQALGRFSRLSGKLASSCHLLILEGTYDEVVAEKLNNKIIDINKAIQSGLTESELEKKLSGEPAESDESFFANLDNMLKSHVEDEYV